MSIPILSNIISYKIIPFKNMMSVSRLFRNLIKLTFADIILLFAIRQFLEEEEEEIIVIIIIFSYNTADTHN